MGRGGGQWVEYSRCSFRPVLGIDRDLVHHLPSPGCIHQLHAQGLAGLDADAAGGVGAIVVGGAEAGDLLAAATHLLGEGGGDEVGLGGVDAALAGELEGEGGVEGGGGGEEGVEGGGVEEALAEAPALEGVDGWVGEGGVGAGEGGQVGVAGEEGVAAGEDDEGVVLDGGERRGRGRGVDERGGGGVEHVEGEHVAGKGEDGVEAALVAEGGGGGRGQVGGEDGEAGGGGGGE